MDESKIAGPTGAALETQITNALTPSDFIQTIRGFSDGLVASLGNLRSLEASSRSNLIVPAQMLLYFGGIVICVSIILRAVPHYIGAFPQFAPIFSFGDFLASLSAGCLLLLVGVFLFVYQFRAEAAKVAAVVETTNEVAKGLVAVLGPDKPKVEPAKHP
jgi:hypothetical protein